MEQKQNPPNQPDVNLGTASPEATMQYVLGVLYPESAARHSTVSSVGGLAVSGEHIPSDLPVPTPETEVSLIAPTHELEAKEVKQEKPVGLEASRVWNELTPERQQSAINSASEMARLRLCEQRGVKPEDFRVVKTGEADNPRYVVIYAKSETLSFGDPTKKHDSLRDYYWVADDEFASLEFELGVDAKTLKVRPSQDYDFFRPKYNESDEESDWWDDSPKALTPDEDVQTIDVRDAQDYDTLRAVALENRSIDEWVWLPREGGLIFDSAPAVHLFGTRTQRRKMAPQTAADSSNIGFGFRPAVELK